MHDASSKSNHGQWLLLTTLWFLISWLAWLTAWLQPVKPVAAGWLWLAALVVIFTALGLRLPSLTPTEPTNDAEDDYVWLLVYGGLNCWIGALAIHATAWIDFFALLTLMLAGEAWLVCVARRSTMEWAQQRISRLLLRLGIGSHSSVGSRAEPTELCRDATVSASQGSPAYNAERSPAIARGTSQSVEVEASSTYDDDLSREPSSTDASGELPVQVHSRCVEGVDSTGQRYFSGEMRIAWEADQTTASFVVAFCPAFSGTPTIDMECETDELQHRIVNCTPTGARLSLRRPASAARGTSLVAWYAAAPLPDQGQPQPSVAGGTGPSLP